MSDADPTCNSARKFSLTCSFLVATQCALTLTAFGKIVGAFEWTAAHSARDPVFHFLTAREMLMVTAILELVVVVSIWRSSGPMAKALWPLWLSTLFAGYRLELWRMGFTGYCSCLGSWSTWMHLSKAQVNAISVSTLAFMFIGAAMIVFSEVAAARMAAATPSAVATSAS